MISYHLEQLWQRTQVNTLVNWVVLIFWSIGPVGNVTFISYYDPMWWFLPLVCITAWNRLLFLVVIIIEWNNRCRRSGNNESISTIRGNWVITPNKYFTGRWYTICIYFCSFTYILTQVGLYYVKVLLVIHYFPWINSFRTELDFWLFYSFFSKLAYSFEILYSAQKRGGGVKKASSFPQDWYRLSGSIHVLGTVYCPVYWIRSYLSIFSWI